MRSLVPKTYTAPLTYYCNLIRHCFSLKSLHFIKSVHAQFIKVGFCANTFLGNRYVELYSKFGTADDAFKAFRDIPIKNQISWNICLNLCVKSDEIGSARKLFDEMPVRDVVSWNTMILGYASDGFLDNALELFVEMQNVGVMPSEFTYSIMTSLVWSRCHGKQIHARMIRSSVSASNVVLGNSLIDLYGRIGLVNYAFGVFKAMEKLDVISWNSLILSCYRGGCGKLALDHFCLMTLIGVSPDDFTVSTVVAVCSHVGDLEKGKQTFALCVKMGFLLNTIVSGAIIDMFSKCNRLEDSVQLFEEIKGWDSVVCNSMISSYAWHGFAYDSMHLFALMFRESIMPTEFTLSSVLSTASALLPVEQGIQVHSLVIKMGMETDSFVASSLIHMYAMFGSVNSALQIFAAMAVRDIISWNTVIAGLRCNGRLVETLMTFKKLLAEGPQPDETTLLEVLLACNYGGFIDEGSNIFSLMEKEYGVRPRDEHYVCIMDMMSRAGKLKEVFEIIRTMSYEPSSLVWGAILGSCDVHGDLRFTEMVAETLMELKPESSLPYLVLARTYEADKRWESLIKVRRAMKERDVKGDIDCSWIGFRYSILVFKSNEIMHIRDKNTYQMLCLLDTDMEDEFHSYQQHNYMDEGEE